MINLTNSLCISIFRETFNILSEVRFIFNIFFFTKNILLIMKNYPMQSIIMIFQRFILLIDSFTSENHWSITIIEEKRKFYRIYHLRYLLNIQSFLLIKRNTIHLAIHSKTFLPDTLWSTSSKFVYLLPTVPTTFSHYISIMGKIFFLC
jgi:hypothetical protein